MHFREVFIFLYVPWSFWLSVNYLMKYTESKEKTLWWYGENVYLYWDVLGLCADLFSSLSILSLFLKSQAQLMPKFKCCTLNLTKHIFLISVCLYMIHKVLELLFWILHNIHNRAHCSVLSCDTQSRIILSITQILTEASSWFISNLCHEIVTLYCSLVNAAHTKH